MTDTFAQRRGAAIDALANDLTEGMTEEGRLIEIGFIGFLVGVSTPGDEMPSREVVEAVSPVAREMMRSAFYAGALHVFETLTDDPIIETLDAELVAYIDGLPP